MRKVQHSSWTLTLALCLGLIAGAVSAAPNQSVASLSAGAAGVEFRPAVGDYEKLVLTVSGPGGQIFRREFAAGETPAFSAFTKGGQNLPDGAYTYELLAVPRFAPGVRQKLAEARRTGNERAVLAELRQAGQLPAGKVQSGGFTMHAGVFVVAGLDENGSGPKAAKEALRPAVEADQVIPDDLIVQGSTCVGFDCVNNENFGFDTIRLKENNLRIKFEDTSVGTFPTNDWQLTANDSASGGQSKFSIEDITGAKVPFTITAGAATNSIFVDSTGRVGFRTSTPVLDLHINTSNTPALRLEQNNSGGFTAQTWDVAGNEANFFVRDVTGGSRLPFRIRPGAPTSSVDISADGDTGIGTASPSASLHVLRSDGSAKLLVQDTNGTAAARVLGEVNNNGSVAFQYIDTSANANAGQTWITRNQNAQFQIVDADAGNEFVLDGAGNLTVTGTVTPGSSRTIKEGFSPVDSRAVLRRVLDLPISSWSYKAAPGVRHVGPMSEDFFAAFAVGHDDSGISVTDSAGVALAAIQGLHQEIATRDAEIATLRARLDELAARVEGLTATK